MDNTIAENQSNGPSDRGEDRAAEMLRRHHRVDDAGRLPSDHAPQLCINLSADGLLPQDHAGDPIRVFLLGGRDGQSTLKTLDHLYQESLKKSPTTLEV